jgi:hypothetical protein
MEWGARGEEGFEILVPSRCVAYHALIDDMFSYWVLLIFDIQEQLPFENIYLSKIPFQEILL